MTSSVVGYHANGESICNNFTAPGSSYFHKCSNDIEYLGTGMYFWDSQYNARWWAEGKVRRGDFTKAVIVRAKIDTTMAWHLNRTENVIEIAGLWNIVASRADRFLGTHKTNPRKPTGKMLDFIFKSFTEYDEKIEVLIGFSSYKMEEIDFLCGSRFSNHFLTRICVRRVRAIIERERVEEWPIMA